MTTKDFLFQVNIRTVFKIHLVCFKKLWAEYFIVKLMKMMQKYDIFNGT